MAMNAETFFSKIPTLEEERDFWRTIRLPNKTWKTTAANRLDDVNASTIGYWNKIGFAPEDVLDVAISSGITTIEWSEALRLAGFFARLVATDIALNAKILRPLPFFSVLVRDTPEMQPLQYGLFHWGVMSTINRGVRAPLSSALAIGLYRALKALSFPMNATKSVQLLSPRVRSDR